MCTELIVLQDMKILIQKKGKIIRNTQDFSLKGKADL